MPLAFLALIPSITTLLTWLFILVGVCIVLAIIAYCVNQMAPPAPVRWAIWGIVLLIVLIWLLHYAGSGLSQF